MFLFVLFSLGSEGKSPNCLKPEALNIWCQFQYAGLAVCIYVCCSPCVSPFLSVRRKYINFEHKDSISLKLVYFYIFAITSPIFSMCTPLMGCITSISVYPERKGKE